MEPAFCLDRCFLSLVSKRWTKVESIDPRMTVDSFAPLRGHFKGIGVS